MAMEEYSSDSDGSDSGSSSGGAYDDDDSSEYTYVTDDDDEALPAPQKRGFGWFGFLRREGRETTGHGDEETEGDDAIANNDDPSTSSSEEDILQPAEIDTHSNDKATAAAELQQQQEEEEAILMEQAIQRVQQRIQSHGNGNIYNVLETHEKNLVDTLRGVRDERIITEVVNKAMDEEEEEKKRERNGELDDAYAPPRNIYHVNTQNEEERNKRQTEGDEEQEEVDHLHDDDHNEEEEEEGPTLEEQRSLLSLAAEHDRVDVIKELLSISQNDQVNASLLGGFSSAAATYDDEDNSTINKNNNNKDASKMTGNSSTNVIFVPPPLHAAVAYGSVNAASCLLRMGADPSIRPVVPTPYLLSSSSSSSSSPTRIRRSSMEEDRNYKKYHDMTAWELAFGGSVVVILENGSTDYEEEEEEVEEVTKKRGWFGFGGGYKKEVQEEEDAAAVIRQERDAHSNNKGKTRIVKRRQPLNIAPKKLEGIRHAFTAEALRAIGADEVDRLQQLLDSGMDSTMEVAGKSLLSWAVEMEAEGCCKLLRSDDEEMKLNDNNSQHSDKSSPTTNGLDRTQQPKNAPANDQSVTTSSQKPITTIHDDRLAGLSSKDILTLIQENENLIPALTFCRDDLAEETSACQNILRDVKASGGRGSLSSQSLLDLVHSLKERRRELEANLKDWQHAWEEREDELDFFWEEVLNDEWREHLAQSGVLDYDDASHPSTAMMGSLNTASLEDLQSRFCEVDNRVNTLRASIASLAEECTRYQAEVERAGLSGALSLTKSLREELKEMEIQLSEAKSGEAICRKKIELIQDRLGNSSSISDEAHENVQHDYTPSDEHEFDVGIDPPSAGQEHEAAFNLAHDFAEREVLEGAVYAEAFVDRGMERENKVRPAVEKDASRDGDDESNENDSAAVEDGPAVENDASRNDESNENDSAAVEDEQQSDFVAFTNVADETIPAVCQPQQIEISESDLDVPSVEHENDDESSDLNDAPIGPPGSVFDALKPSDALKSGMSTAIVVRQPSGHRGSLSLQLWELLRRIVGLGRTPGYRGESSANIMIV